MSSRTGFSSRNWSLQMCCSAFSDGIVVNRLTRSVFRLLFLAVLILTKNVCRSHVQVARKRISAAVSCLVFGPMLVHSIDLDNFYRLIHALCPRLIKALCHRSPTCCPTHISAERVAAAATFSSAIWYLSSQFQTGSVSSINPITSDTRP